MCVEAFWMLAKRASEWILLSQTNINIIAVNGVHSSVNNANTSNVDWILAEFIEPNLRYDRYDVLS